MRRLSFVLVSCLLMHTASALAHRSSTLKRPVADEPWDPPIAAGFKRTFQVPSPSHGPLVDLLLTSVSWYRGGASAASVSRCPFVVSCSHYAMHVLHTHGLLGIPLILDRLLIRENLQAYAKYKRVILSDGTLRLDDAVKGF